MQYKPHYTYLAAMIPAPNQPDMVAISNVLRPFVDKFINMSNGKKMFTHLFPKGQIVEAKLVALLGDVVAAHKVAGFMSHSAK